MTAAEYLTTICQPNVVEFRNQPTSILRAWNALVSLRHVADYIANDRGATLKAVYDELEAECPAYGRLRDIADASKHFVMDQRHRRRGLSVSNLRVGAGVAFSDGSYWSDGASFKGIPDVVRTEFGSEYIDLQHTATEVLSYLATKV